MLVTKKPSKIEEERYTLQWRLKRGILSPTWYFGQPLIPRYSNQSGKLDQFLDGIRGLILDLGSGNRKLPGHRTIAFDIRPYSSVDIIGDAHHIPFKSNSFDAIVLQEVLEHVEKPDGVLEECHRILKPAGTIFVTTPFCYHEHGGIDLWRFTIQGLRMICKRFFIEMECGPIMGGSSALANIAYKYIEITITRGRNIPFLTRAVRLCLSFLLSWLKFLDPLINSHLKEISQMAGCNYWVGRKQNLQEISNPYE